MSAIGLRKREAIFKRDRWTCQCCGATSIRNPRVTLEVDHIVPRARGGSNNDINLQTLCRPCNASKSDWYEEDEGEGDDL